MCVIDFECTCEEATRDFPFEIIEFPVVLVNLSTMLVVSCRPVMQRLHHVCAQEDRFEAFVRPIANPVLSTFCTQLTSITQACCITLHAIA